MPASALYGLIKGAYGATSTVVEAIGERRRKGNKQEQELERIEQLRKKQEEEEDELHA